jgi:hypothetical protein
MGFDVGGITLTSPSGTTFSMDNGATNWMKVNADGILTRPQTPFMRGQLTGLGSPHVANPLMITAIENVGGCWNNATGKWTCPIDGYYMTQSGHIAGNNGYGYFYLYHNGTIARYTHWNIPATWVYCTLSGIVKCAAGDTLWWGISGGGGASWGFYGGGGHGMDSIALMA